MDSEDFASLNLHRPLVHFSLVGSIDGIPVALSKLRVLGFISQVDIPKVGKPNVGPNPSMLREKLGVVRSIPDVCHCAGGGAMSQLLLPVSMQVASPPPPAPHLSADM